MAKMLGKKLRRDLRLDIKSFIAVFVICMLSVTLYLGIDVGWRGMEKAVHEQFETCAFANMWVPGNLSSQMASQIANLDGVSDAQRQIMIRTDVKDIAGDPQLMLMQSDGEARVDKPLMLTGETFPEGYRNTCYINQTFMKAHNLKLGDMLTVTYGQHRIMLRIVGVAHSARYIVQNDQYSFRADVAKFGYAFVSEGTLSFLPYNETAVRLDEGADLPTVKSEIEQLINDKEIAITTRNDLMGIKMAEEEAGQIKSLGTVFPAVFFLVAALITFSTMKRMVDQQRQQIGTLCSLGYTKKQLTRHYMSYGLIISLFGSLAGVAGGYYGVGKILVTMLCSVYVMPGCEQLMDVPVAVGVSLVVIAIATGASYLSCRQALKEVPSGLLRPKPPQSGKRAWIEKIPFLWNHLSFSNKLILRNMSRNKMRLFIGLVGVAGCTALMLTGFGMRDSVAYVLSNHYGSVMRYDVRATLNGSYGDDYISALGSRSGANNVERAMEGTLEIKQHDRYEIRSFFVFEDQHNEVRLNDKEGNIIKLPAEGAAISERMSEETGLKKGDIMHLRAPSGKEGIVQVTDVISIQLGQGIYMSASAWRKLDLMPYVPSSLMLSGDHINMEALRDMDGVDRVRTINDELTGNQAVLIVLNVVVVIMVLFAGILALVVLYTLGQLNFHERIRELATLMVLGFFPRESKRLILRENILTALIGIPIGLLVGPYLHSWVLSTGLPQTIEFVPYIAPSSWVYASLFALSFAELVNILVGAKFKDVDMVESLKSVE